MTTLRHGRHGTSEYHAWAGLSTRCRSPGNPGYQNYGGRGIKVCDRWRDFENFLADMGEKPSRNLSIERIDNEGDYEPGNCRWATPSEQQRNKRHSPKNTSGVVGVTFDKSRNKWIAQIKIAGKRIGLGRFVNIDEATAARREAERTFGFYYQPDGVDK